MSCLMRNASNECIKDVYNVMYKGLIIMVFTLMRNASNECIKDVYNVMYKGLIIMVFTLIEMLVKQ